MSCEITFNGVSQMLHSYERNKEMRFIRPRVTSAFILIDTTD